MRADRHFAIPAIQNAQIRGFSVLRIHAAKGLGLTRYETVGVLHAP